SCFRVYLPAAPAGSIESAAEPAEDPVEPGPRLRGSGEGTILLVEDDGFVRPLAAATLRAEGYRVLEAPDGRAAVEIFESRDGQIDLLVTDVVMPDIGGLAVAALVRERRPDLPVIFASGYPDRISDERFAPLGDGEAFLQKPFTPGELIEKVRE